MTFGAIVRHHRYGVGPGDEHALADVARELGMSRPRVRRIEAQPLAHVQEPALSTRRHRTYRLAGTA